METEKEPLSHEETSPATENGAGAPHENGHPVGGQEHHVSFATAEDIHQAHGSEAHTTHEPQSAIRNPKSAIQKGDSFKTVLSLLMALVVVSGAVITWRSTLDGEEATKEDAFGLTATVNQQGARVESNANAYQHFQSFTNYAVHQGLGDQIAHNMQAATPNPTDVVAQAKQAQQQLELTNQYAQAFSTRLYFQSRYLGSNGDYNTTQEIGATLADKAKQADLQPDKHFEEADTLRSKSNNLLLSLLILGVSLLCYTLIGALGAKLARRLQWPLVSVGLLLTLIAIGYALRVEFF